MGIFNRFLDKVHHKHEEPIMPPPSPEDFMEQFDQYRQLMELQDQRQLLEVLLPGQKYSFQSMVVGIDFVEAQFSLDEFSPRLNNPQELLYQTVIIRHQKHWELLEFAARIVGWSEENDCYLLGLPEVVSYQPRRSHSRLVLAKQDILNATISPPYGAPWYATVKDISPGGMRVNLSGDLRPHLHRGKALPKCLVMLDKEITIISRGEVRSYSYSGKPYRNTEVSIEFSGMSHLHQEHLKNFISYIEVAA